MEIPYFIEPFVDTGLGNSAYLIGSHDTKKAILIDPLRDVDRYLYAASERGLTLTHVLDTHLHADFISGNREIANQTGAKIGASAEANIGFAHNPLTEASIIDMVAFQIHVINTPGHTPEHIAFLLTDSNGGTPRALFSGGALIVGGAARTDLISPEMTLPLARHLYHTIHNKLLKLPDEVDVFPTHGAGSFCVAPASSERITTIGRERKTNPLTQAQDEKEFIQRAISGLPLYPTYYQHMRSINQQGARILGGIPSLKPISPQEAKLLQDSGVVILDIRNQKAFSEGHIPNSFNIRVDAPLIVWAGWVIPFESSIILLGETASQREDALRQLIRIGYDNVLGYIEGGIDAWAGEYPIGTVQSMTVTELAERRSDVNLLDVRSLAEWESGHIEGAAHFEGGRIAWEELPVGLDRPIAVQCASGNRSMIAISVLMRKGIHNLIQVEGGIDSWKAKGFKVVTTG